MALSAMDLFADIYLIHPIDHHMISSKIMGLVTVSCRDSFSAVVLFPEYHSHCSALLVTPPRFGIYTPTTGEGYSRRFLVLYVRVDVTWPHAPWTGKRDV